MSQKAEWIELYNILESGANPYPQLVEKCKSSRTGIGETMLHWYAIEGSPDVLQKLINLGLEVNVQNSFGNTPIMECAQISRWDNARVLFSNGADLKITNEDGLDFFSYLSEYDIDIPDWIKGKPGGSDNSEC
jgi:ankyrin repeat protein